MPITAHVFGALGRHLASGSIDWVGNSFNVTLHGSGYTPDQDVHDYFDDATNEVSGGNYPPGGIALSNKAISYDAATNTNRHTADPAVFGSAGAPVSATFRYAVVRKSRGGAASADELVSWIDFGGDETIVGGIIEIDWPATGVFASEAQ